MKILEINSVPISYPGGTEKIVLELSERFSKRHDVTVLQTNLYMEEHEAGEKKLGKIKVITCLNNFFLGGMGFSMSFRKKLKEIYSDYDVIHIHGHGRFTSLYALWFLKNKKPVIYTAHGFFHTSKFSLAKKFYDYLFKSLKTNAFCTAITPLEKESYASLGISKDKIIYLPNWVDLKKLKRVSPKKYFENNFPTILHVGRIQENKGLPLVLESIKNLDVNFLVAGRDVGYVDKMKKEISKLNLSSKVKYLDSPSDKERNVAYSSADVFILFSEWEALGLVVLEAMAFGLPVVVSDRGGLPFIVEDGKNGFVVEYKDVSKLRDKIRLICDRPDLRKSFGRENLRFVKNFNIDSVIKLYEELYEKVTER